jgi:hypothetical protein
MEMSTKVNGKMIKLMVKVYIPTLIVVDTKVIGLRTNNTGMVWKDGQTVHLMRDNMSKVKSMAVESLLGLTEALLLENFLTTTFKAMVSTNGLMVESLLENGKTIRWMGTAHLLG